MVTLGSASASGLAVLLKDFRSDEQGPVRHAILYMDRPC